MVAVVIDTDVVSFLFKRDSRANLYREYLADKILIVSFMTIAELDRWAIERKWGQAKKDNMEEHLRKFVIYPFNRVLCLEWAKLSDLARRKGRPIQCADAWIAATASLYDIPLVTHNYSHYSGIDNLKVVFRSNSPL